MITITTDINERLLLTFSLVEAEFDVVFSRIGDLCVIPLLIEHLLCEIINEIKCANKLFNLVEV